MIEGTFRQWHHYCVEHGLDPVERMVLFGLVFDHSARERFTRPGIRRLAELSGASTSTVGPVLRRLQSMDAITLLRRHPRGGRRADEYEIPWLANGAVDNHRRASRNRDANRDANRDTSSPLRGDRRSAPRQAGAPAAAPSAGDATGYWCEMCEERVADGSSCPCGEECAQLIGCLVNPATARYYGVEPGSWRPALRVVPS